MTTAKKPTKVDWAIASVLFFVAFVGFVIWIAQPNPETQSQCNHRVANEIKNRKLAAGETTINSQQEIEAIASEIKSKCRY